MSKLRTAVFGYGSLANPTSAGLTLGRPVVELIPATLLGWRRRFSQARDNLAAEKTFAAPDGSLPRFILGLNLEPDAPDDEAPNGVLIAIEEAELFGLDRRELRYDRIDVTGAVRAGSGEDPRVARFDRILTYRAKPQNLATQPPPGSVILAGYLAATEAGFDQLGSGQLDRWRATTGPAPAPVIEATLVRDRIPPGNPREW